jgi:hypothetical protein
MGFSDVEAQRMGARYGETKTPALRANSRPLQNQKLPRKSNSTATAQPQNNDCPVQQCGTGRYKINCKAGETRFEPVARSANQEIGVPRRWAARAGHLRVVL